MADAESLMLRAFQESWGDIVDPRDGPYFDDIASGYQRAQHATMRRDRMDGRFLPVYDNEVDLAIIRAMARLMHERVPMAKARTKRLVDYTISRGFDWTVGHEDKALQVELQLLIKRFFDDNKFTAIGERESFESECVDGEWLAEIAVDSGEIALNLFTSDSLVEPSNTAQLDEWLGVDFDASWSFGVLSKRYSPNRPRGYHIVRDIGGTDWDFIPERRFLHWKKNTPEIAKRGFGDAYTTHVYLGRADKVLANTAEGAAVQAAIAYICEHLPGTSGTQAQNVVSNLMNVTTRDPITGYSRRSKKIVPGQRVDIPSGMKYHAGLFGSNNSQVYIQVMESLIRLSGIVDAMPEHFLTGSAENNNMASSLVAESPFVQGRLAEQTVRKQRLKSMIEKVIRLAIDLKMIKGYTWEEVLRGLKITIQEPSIVSRDPVAQTQALGQQMELKLTSKRTASQELGRDYEQEQQNIEKETPEPPPMMPGQVPPGSPLPPAGPPNAGTPVPNQPAASQAGAKAPMGESVKGGVALRSVALGVQSLDDLKRLSESATGVVVASDGESILERDLALYAYANQGADDVAALPKPYQAWFFLSDRLTEEVKDGDGDGLINDGKPNEAPAPAKLLMKSKPGTHKGAGSSGVDTTAWSDKGSGKWAIKKVHALELAAANGDWDAVAKGGFTPSDSKGMNNYQKGVVAAQKALLAKKDAIVTAPAQTPGTWTKIGGQLGSQEGGTYTGPDGGKYYVKTSSDPERPKNEALAFRLYHAAGAGAVDSTLAAVGGKLGVATNWMESDKVDWNDSGMRAKAAEDFAVHAWLANWDAVGHESEMDNIRLDKTGKLRLVDAGGSLTQKAMGGTKPFGESVAEWDSLRNPDLNPSGAKVFGGMTPEQLATSVKKLDNVSDDDIRSMVGQMGPPGDANGKLADTLIARKKDLQAKAKAIMAGKGVLGYGDPAPAAKVDPMMADLDAMINGPAVPMPIPTPPKILSPKNPGYQKHVDAIHSHALNGDVEAVKSYKTNPTSTQTYAKKLHAYKMQVMAAMGSGSTSAATPKPTTTLDASQFPTKPELTTSNAAAKAENHSFMDKALSAAATGDMAALKAMSTPSPKVGEWHKQLQVAVAKQTLPLAPLAGSPLTKVFVADVKAAAMAGDMAKLTKLGSSLDYHSASQHAKQYHADVTNHLGGSVPKPAVVTPTDKDLAAASAKVGPLVESYGKLTEHIAPKPSKNAPKVGYWSVVGSVPVTEHEALGSFVSNPAGLWDKGYGMWAALPSDESNAIVGYTSSAYDAINTALRGQSGASDWGKAKSKEAVAGLKKAAHLLPVGISLSRHHDGDMSGLKPGDVVSEPGILSTATTPESWSGKNTWVMTVGPGVKGLAVDYFSSNKGEKEVILPPNSRLVVTKSEPGKGKYGGHKIHAVILPNEHHL